MDLAIMQPYFFPYLGYFHLIKKTNRFIVFDDVQYIRRGWINRNRILKPSGSSWQYITAPLKPHKRSDLIKDIIISNEADWRGTILRQLEHYKKKAPYFLETYNLVKEGLNCPDTNLAGVNVHCLNLVCNHLGLTFNFEYSSKLNLDYSAINAPGDWGLEISKQLNAKKYVNLSGGEDIYEANRFIEQGIILEFLPKPSYNYKQCSWLPFESNLSIIDALMFNRPEEIMSLISVE
jgi:hypothetical protein